MNFTELGVSKQFCRRIFNESIEDHIRYWLDTFAEKSTQLETRITFLPIVKTILYPASWKYLYRGMFKLWLAQRRRSKGVEQLSEYDNTVVVWSGERMAFFTGMYEFGIIKVLA